MSDVRCLRSPQNKQCRGIKLYPPPTLALTQSGSKHNGTRLSRDPHSSDHVGIIIRVGIISLCWSQVLRSEETTKAAASSCLYLDFLSPFVTINDNYFKTGDCKSAIKRKSYNPKIFI